MYEDWPEYIIGLYQLQRRGIVTEKDLITCVKTETYLAVDKAIQQAYERQLVARAPDTKERQANPWRAR